MWWWLAVILACSVGVVRGASAGCDDLHGDGKLALYSYPHRTWQSVDLGRPGTAFTLATTYQLEQLFRSPDGAHRPMDPRLIRLLDHLQDHFGADTVEVISGYRSPAYNGALKETGHGVARESFHLQGQAADIHLDEVREETVHDYAQSLGCGGVGFYPSLHFVHVDLGPVRRWAEAAGARKLVGEAPFVLVTDRNYYAAGESVHWSTEAAMEADAPVTVEHFRRGQWTAQRRVPLRGLQLTCGTAPLVFGKFRLRAADGLSFSNEFYCKRM